MHAGLVSQEVVTTHMHAGSQVTDKAMVHKKSFLHKSYDLDKFLLHNLFCISRKDQYWLWGKLTCNYCIVSWCLCVYVV